MNVLKNKGFLSVLTGALALVSGHAVAKESYVACSFERASLAEPKKISGCSDSACSHFKDGTQVCKCLNDKSTLIQVRRDHAVPLDFAASAFVGDTSDFESLRGSLASAQDNPHAVLIVANRDSETNGIPFSKWTVTIIDEKTMVVLHQFPVAEYGPGIFARKKQTDQARGCDVLVTKWAESRDSKDKSGTYYTGTWFQWDTAKHELVAVPDRPAVQRRLLQSFEKEWFKTYRNHGGSSMDIPLRWFQSATVEEIPRAR